MSLSSLRTGLFLIIVTFGLSLPWSYVWAAAISDTYVDFQANNCTIPAGKSMCPSTLYVTTYAWRSFNVTNLNRGLTTQNLLTPNNYITIPGSTSPAYTVSTHITGDAANYISYGESNNLNLFEGTRLIARAITSARCTSGTIWNGQICSTPGAASPIACTMEARMCQNGTVMPRNMNTCTWLPDQCDTLYPTDPLPPTLNNYVTFTAKSCVIPEWKSTCVSTASVTSTKYIGTTGWRTFSLRNATRNITTSNLFTPNSTTLNSAGYPVYTVSTSVLGDAANYLTNGVNDLILTEWGINVAKMSVTTSCVTGSTWNGQICTSSSIPVTPWLATSKVNLKTGNGDTVFSDELYKNISKNAYLPEQVTKNISLPSTTSVLNITLSSSKAQCSVSPNYKTDSGVSFSNNAKVVNKADLPNFAMTLPVYSSASQIWATLYGKISTITISCDTSSESTKDFLIYNIAFGTLSPSAYIDFQANNCTIPAGKSTCASTLYLTAPSGKYFSVKNATRGITTSNLLNPNNYISVAGSSTPMYSVSTHVTGDAANYAKYGDNDLVLYEWTSTVVSIAKAVMNATCASGSTWNGQMCMQTWIMNCSGPARVCDDWREMPRNPNTCEWIPEQCTPATYATHIGLSDYIINDKVYAYNWAEIIVKEWETLSIKWYGRPGALAYFWREWQIMTDSVGLSSTTGEWMLTNVWSPAGAKIVIPGTYTYILSGLPPSTVPGTMMQSAQTAVRIKVAPATTDSYIDFQANNCTIPVGKSTCASTLYLTNPLGKLYSVKNITRGLTTSNLLTPNNYTTVPGSNYPSYSVSTHPTGDAANYATNWINELSLFDSTSSSATAIKKAVMTASCTSGSTWNGQICTSGITTPPTNTPKPMLFIERNPKILWPGQNMTLSWTTTNATSLSYFCSGLGVQANKKVSIAVNSSPYSNSWDKLISDGWTGKYECDFIAVGPGGSTVVADAFTITPRSTTPNPTPYTDFQANNCTIQANKSTCVSSIFVRASAGKYFHVTNATRALTTSNLLNPTNYVSVIGSTTPMYMATTHSTGDAANYITYGVNDLILKEGASVISKAVATAECVKWTSWNGKICIAGWGVACTDVVKYCEDGSIMPRDPNCGWLPGQCGGRVAEPLTISCSKSTYAVGESISCKIDGWVGTKSCWQLGTRNTEPTACTNVGWIDNGSLYYYSSVSTSMLWEYTLYVKDSQWTTATTKINYINTSTPPISSTINFEANNCTISPGQSKCASTLYVKAPAGKYYSVSNLNRGITTSNLLNPKNYMTIAGSSSPMYSVGVSSSWDAANYITYGESNTLTLLEGNTIVARAIASAKCMTGSTWNGIACSGWWGSSTEPNPVCSKVGRTCENGSLMPRNPKTCEWLPNECSIDPIELYPIDPLPPIKPYGNPTIQVLSIGWLPLNSNNYIEISKSPTAPLKVEWEITSVRSGYTIKLTSNKSDFFILMPVNSNWVWTSSQSPTDDIYKSRIVVEWDNLLTFSLIDDATKKPIAQTFVKVKVKFVRGGIIIPPICVMAAGSTGTCLPPPTTPTYPNCPKPGTSNSATTSSLIYCPIDDAIEINPTNTISIKPPVRWNSGGIIAIPPTCIMASGSTGTCLPPPTTPTYPNCPRTTTSANSISSSSMIYCPPDDGTEINPTNTINPKPSIRKPPVAGTGVRVPVEQPTIPPCRTTGGNSLTIGCTGDSVDVVIVDGMPTTPLEEALDAASRKRIDMIIARTRSRVADMSTSAGIAFIDSAIKRIQSLPNKTSKAKLIDAYTLSRLQSLRNTIRASSANNPTDDYIGLVDNVLSN